MHNEEQYFATALRGLGGDQVSVYWSRRGHLWDASELPQALRGPRILMAALTFAVLLSFPAVELSPYFFTLLYCGGGMAIIVTFFAAVKRGNTGRLDVTQGFAHRALWAHAATLPLIPRLRRRWELKKLLDRAMAASYGSDDAKTITRAYSTLLAEVRPTLALPDLGNDAPKATLVNGDILVSRGGRAIGIHHEYSEAFRVISPCCLREPKQSVKGWLCPCGRVVHGYIKFRKEHSWDERDLDSCMKDINAFLEVNPLTATILRSDVERLIDSFSEDILDEPYDDLMAL